MWQQRRITSRPLFPTLCRNVARPIPRRIQQTTAVVAVDNPAKIVKSATDWQRIARIALVGAIAAVAYYYLEKLAKKEIGK